jgi:dTDP-4-amino-4,6-dideoxygalactose transaminase
LKIPFLDVGESYLELKSEIDIAISRVLDSGCYILGSEVEAFEKEWAKYCEAKYAVGLGSGLDALILALRSLDVGPGDEVIVPSHTYIATWMAITAVGAIPVPVEPSNRTYNIDPDKIAASITKKTKVFLPVHLYGQAVNIDPIIGLANQHGIKIIEDAAQAHGARYKGRRIGSHGHIVCWSFYPGKNLGAFGDAGAITTNDQKIAERIALLRNYGSKKKYFNNEIGINSRLDPLQAAVLSVKLKILDKWTEQRCTIANTYKEKLNNCGLILPYVPDWANPVWHLYVVRSQARNKLQDHLTKTGIETLIHYPIPPHMQAAYNNLNIPAETLPLSKQISQEILSLPIGPHLNNDKIVFIIDEVIKISNTL